MTTKHQILIILGSIAITISQLASPQTKPGESGDLTKPDLSKHAEESKTKQLKPKTTTTSSADQQARNKGSYLQGIVQLSPSPSPSLSSPDASEIVPLIGSRAPFTLMPRGSSAILIYSPKATLTPSEHQLLNQIETEITTLAAIQPRILEISVSNASALGSLLRRAQSLNYGDIKVEAVGNDKIRAIFGAQVRPERIQAFVRDVQRLAAQAVPDSPVARVFFIDAPEAATVLGGKSNPKTPKDSGSPASPGKSDSSSTGSQDTTQQAEDGAESIKNAAATGTTTAKAKAKKKSTDGGDKPSSASNDTASDEDPSADGARNGKHSGSIAHTSTGVESLNSDLLVFSNEDPGDDGEITEKKRILAAVDSPRPEVIINTFSFQTSSSNPDALYDITTRIQREIGKYNDGLQLGIARAWSYLDAKMSTPSEFFDPDFYSYVTKRYVADAATESDTGLDLLASLENTEGGLSKARLGELRASIDKRTRDQSGICDPDKYCLGYTSLFHPLRPSLTDMLIAIIAARAPEDQIQQAITEMEGHAFAVGKCPPLPKQKSPCDIPQFQTCEEKDQDALRRQDFNQGFIFPMNCFRNTAEEVFVRSKLVRPLSTAVANFLFHYKMSQQYHEFSPYGLSQSAQELNSELNPLVLAFNRDLAAALRPLKDVADPRSSKGNSWFGFAGHGTSFVNNGIISVRTISGKETTVDTTTQNFFDVTNPPSITDIISSIGSSESNVPKVLKSNLSANQAAVIIGALNSVKPAQSKIGRELKIDITPRSLSGASAAELDITLNAKEAGEPTVYSNGKSEADNISRVAQRTTQTKVRLESAKLFEISSFTALLQRSRRNLPLLPPLVEIPYIGSILSIPLPGAKEYHSSTAVMSAVVVPTAADLANGVAFTADRIALAKDDTDRTCPLGAVVAQGNASKCTLRRAASTNELGAYSIRNYHKAMISCLGSGFPYPSMNSSVEGAAGASCNNLRLSGVPPEGP